MAWCSPSLFPALVQVSKSKAKSWTGRERDSACPEEIAAGVDRKERKYYYSSLTDGKPRRRELKRLAKSQTEIWKQPGTESRSAETQASALITRLLIVIIFLQLLFTRIDYEISASSYSCSAPTASSAPHVIPLPSFFLLYVSKHPSPPTPPYEGAQQTQPSFVCSTPGLPHKQIPFFFNTDSICPQSYDNSCLVLKAPSQNRTFTWLLWKPPKLWCSVPWKGRICRYSHTFQPKAWPQTPAHSSVLEEFKQRAYANPLLSITEGSPSYFRSDGRNNLSIFRNEHKCPL